MSWREFAKSIPILSDWAREPYRKYFQWRYDSARLLTKVLRRHEHLQVVQIGSNDGRSGDPIHALLLQQPTWQALLVEPVPSVFAKLRQNYSSAARFRFENVAVAERAGELPFYYIAEEAREQATNVSLHFDQLGSFDRGHILRHCGTALDAFVVTTNIPTVPLAPLLERNGVTRIDLLHIDTEGSDWIVLRQLDLRRFQPIVILFEHKHLSAEARNEALRFLLPDYEITDLGGDFFCRRKSA